ncbi:fungal-specific transcription factor domain-containing protein [Podospora didyma]|uniref:Fungal-specific transcription factor domain-containing protein n=1 Tax=Podospora didyma TaxID=330526 RepID=A0AAE0NSL4_9PEZI|nr:fungal-specific transcription factor domain-containing protein [Podospora didyma]
MSSSSTEEGGSQPRAISADADFPKQDVSDDAPTRPPPKKRRRTVISCTECHRRKQKCDRNLPCTNCVSRGKQNACRYETGAPRAKDHGRHLSNSNGATAASPDKEEAGDSIPTKVANFGYSRTGASTLGFLQKIEGAHPDEPLSSLNAADSGQHGDHFNTRERYKSLIRQLPARTFIDKLADIYFTGFNWQYFALDRDLFDKQLADWYKLPFSLLTTGGPQALPADLRVFPGLLFQVLATALLLVPSGSGSDSSSEDAADSTFDSLKYAGNMTLEDLALDYSESGVAILSLLGKRQMTITTVLAGFLRASFLKYVALVTEAWHAIGMAIRDAQEIGLHRDSLDPKPKSDDVEALLENQWEIQRRRKIWMILTGWDIHTGVILGRPTTISLNCAPPTLPIDAPIPKDRSKTPVMPRAEGDPPTPLTRALWAYHTMHPLLEVLKLEKEGPCPKDFSRVDKLHQQLLDLEEVTPPYFRLENPDTTFDDDPQCYWLPFVRATLPQLMSFNFMALHRPYIFTRPKSRTEALRASLNMLQAQRMYFKSLPPQQYKAFSLFFGTFDAIVMMASIYILFPKEHPDLVRDALQHFDWAVQRFEAMSERNALAKAGLGVLRAINLRLQKSLGLSCQAARAMLISPPLTTPSGSDPSPSLPFWDTPAALSSASSASTATPATTASGDVFPSSSSNNGYTNGRAAFVVFPGDTTTSSSAGGTTVATTTSSSTGGFDWNLPSNFDLASLQPIYATSDLLYNDLMGIGDEAMASVPAAAAASTSWDEAVAQQPWQFEGDFGDDSVWNLLNQYAPL